MCLEVFNLCGNLLIVTGYGCQADNVPTRFVSLIQVEIFRDGDMAFRTYDEVAESIVPVTMAKSLLTFSKKRIKKTHRRVATTFLSPQGILP